MPFIVKPVGELAANAYLLFAEDGAEAVVIDPGAEPEAIREALAGRRLAGILLTHGHFDHIGAVSALRSAEAPVHIHREDAAMLTNSALSLATMIGGEESQGTADVLLADGQMLSLAGLDIEVLHTPGHTPGGVCYRVGDDLFTGDTLFRQGYGRTDFPGGDMRQLGQSIRRLCALPPVLRVHPGHGASTTIGDEKQVYHL